MFVSATKLSSWTVVYLLLFTVTVSAQSDDENVVEDVASLLNTPLAKRDEFRIISAESKVVGRRGDQVQVDVTAENWEHKSVRVKVVYVPSSRHVLSAEYAQSCKAIADFQPLSEAPPGLDATIQRRIDEINEKALVRCRVDESVEAVVTKKIIPTRGTRFRSKFDIVCGGRGTQSRFSAEVDAMYIVPKDLQNSPDKPRQAGFGRGSVQGMRILRFSPSEIPLNISSSSSYRDEALSAIDKINVKRCRKDHISLVHLHAYKHRTAEAKRSIVAKVADVFGTAHHVDLPLRLVSADEHDKYEVEADILHYHPHAVEKVARTGEEIAEFVRRWLSERLASIGIRTLEVLEVEQLFYSAFPPFFIISVTLRAHDSDGRSVDFSFHSHVKRKENCKLEMDLSSSHHDVNKEIPGVLGITAAMTEKLRQRRCNVDEGDEAALFVEDGDVLSIRASAPAADSPCRLLLKRGDSGAEHLQSVHRHGHSEL
uniref:Uncharacterized protein n=1 Tax=Palpitomonas bilix TaxID=652834 RepID=A0A7S3DH94_9EUKA|mmetsp:Transcript_36796/g.95283  ORF Transcript_36796/g.95283 Transcript_36796/m.95283 type:complete len:484 (+) Transcript_36796:179-1630(+)